MKYNFVVLSLIILIFNSSCKNNRVNLIDKSHVVSVLNDLNEPFKIVPPKNKNEIIYRFLYIDGVTNEFF